MLFRGGSFNTKESIEDEVARSPLVFPKNQCFVCHRSLVKRRSKSSPRVCRWCAGE